MTSFSCSGVPVANSDPLAIDYSLSVTFMEVGGDDSNLVGLPDAADVNAAIAYVFNDQPLNFPNPDPMSLSKVLRSDLDAANPYFSTTSFELS